MMRLARGFTLLEVLIALAILAISATAIIGQASNSLHQLSVLEEKTVAHLLAESEINKLIASEAFPSPGRTTEFVTFNARQWQISIAVSGTTEPWLRKVVVSVSDSNSPDADLATLTTFRGRY